MDLGKSFLTANPKEKKMKKFIVSVLKGILRKFDKDTSVVESFKKPRTKIEVKESKKLTDISLPKKAKKKLSILSLVKDREVKMRDMTEIMEVPFLALSKNRREPIIYEKHNGPNDMIRVKISRHTGHFLASIYDWDIVLLVAGKMQEILDNRSDIPPRTIIIPRHEILKSLRRGNGKKQEKDLEASLARLKMTGIETTIRNEDYRYRGGFGFLDSWGYTERKDIKEIHITLSQWLYDGICSKGSLLKVEPEYFGLTSALKRFLYRTARKHIGGHGETFEFSIEKLYEKSGSEREFKKFKSDLKKVVSENDIPGYFLKWIERQNNSFVSFKNLRKIPSLKELNELSKDIQ
jgi:plasmid replication initiation protein